MRYCLRVQPALTPPVVVASCPVLPKSITKSLVEDPWWTNGCPWGGKPVGSASASSTQWSNAQAMAGDMSKPVQTKFEEMEKELEEKMFERIKEEMGSRMDTQQTGSDMAGAQADAGMLRKIEENERAVSINTTAQVGLEQRVAAMENQIRETQNVTSAHLVAVSQQIEDVKVNQVKRDEELSVISSQQTTLMQEILAQRCSAKTFQDTLDERFTQQTGEIAAFMEKRRRQD